MKNIIKYRWKIVLALVSSATILSLHSNPQSAKDVFLSMPESTFLYLTSFNRMNLLNSYSINPMQASILNAFGDTITLKNLTKNYLLLKIQNASLQLIILPMINKSKIYCIIYTICELACDSFIEFYSVSWEQLQTNLFIKPIIKSYFIDENFNNTSLDISFIQFIYNPKTLLLQQIYNVTNLSLGIEDQQQKQNFLKKNTKTYKWNGFQFV